MTDTTTALLELMYKLAYGGRKPDSNMTDDEYRKHKGDYLRRGLCSTPYKGNYGMISGWVVCVVGSPPKGTITMPINGESRPRVEGAYFFYGRSSDLSEKQDSIEVLQAFVTENLVVHHVGLDG